MRTTSCILVLAFLFLSLPEARADVLVLENGMRFEGEIIEETETTVKMKTSWGEVTVQKSRLKEIVRKEGAEGPCPACAGSGEITCDRCNGKKMAPGCCPKCKGLGKKECKHCRGTGKIKCVHCKGTGERTIWVPGRGMTKGRCKKCNGHGWLYCGRCKGTKFEACKTCKGTGAGPCGKCGRTGKTPCILCNGTGKRNDQRSFLRKSFAELKKILEDPKNTELQRKHHWDEALGKHVLWPAIMVAAGKHGAYPYLHLNLDRNDVRTVFGRDGKPLTVYAGHVYANFNPDQTDKVLRIQSGEPLWIVGKISDSGGMKIRLVDSEILLEGLGAPVKEEKGK